MKTPDSGQDEDEIPECGLGSFTPKALQCCNNLLSFSFVYGFAVLLTQALGMYISSQITTLERQFDLSSTDSGIIMSCNDIGFLATVLFMSYYGPRGHIPRIIALCAFLYGASGVLSSLPQFITDGKMEGGVAQGGNASSTNVLCGSGLGNDSDRCSSRHHESGDNAVKWVVGYLGICLVIQGIGKTPRSALGTLYLDSSTDKTKTGLYLGITTTMGLFGPFLALTLGGVFGRIPVDLKDTSITPRDPRWIGAWWIGFLMFGILAIISSIPICLYPKRDVGHNKESQTEEEKKSLCTDLKGIPLMALRIFQRPVYLLNLLGLSLLLFGVMGMSSFGPKYIENQFYQPTWKANLLLGGEKLITGTIGTFLGGLISSRLKLNLQGCLRMIVIVTTITAALESLTFVFGCSNTEIHGLNWEQGTSSDTHVSCACAGASFLTVCGKNGMTFYSPCHAGCTNETNNVYDGCSLAGGIATPGICDTDCPYLIPYMVTSIISTLTGTLAIMPMYLVILRSVAESDRSLAMGINSFILSLVVFLPAPIVFGKLFDGTCKLWKDTCGSKGACKLYDIVSMRYIMVAMEVGLRIAALLVYIVAYFVAIRQARREKKDGKEDINDMELKVESQRL
ncbi:hypothetical protein FSP39_024570 [Pinctada imbricata]|uniref:Solute carrier organic anion transporter family member n=1 Tax=Pinctada imbricata TaxID=66713 RepID=A0AA88XNT4_PINIB|nr:hypothetical protein FSP39_024570 [Pinctada imbricata]